MKGRVVHLDRIGDRLAAALVLDGQLDDLLIEGPENCPVPGAIYRGIVDRPMKGQGGVTLRLPEGRGWLRQAKGMRQGEAVIVQVTGYADDGKAVPVTDRILFKSRHVIVTPGAPGYNVSRRIKDDERREALLELAHDVAGPPEGRGLILRSSANHAPDDEVADDIATMLEAARRVLADSGDEAELLMEGPDPHLLAWRDWDDPDAVRTEPGNFARDGIDAMIDALRRPRVDLGAAWISIEPTCAMIAVDVNTGGDTSLAAGLKANIAAARALPAQMRCRGLGGQITVDFAPQPKKDRRVLEQILRAAFKADPVDTVLAGWTPLGCFELQRKRDRLPLSRLLAEV
ncbi:ribonuclease, Rne/Rng family protein [Oceaniovalibus guishaninsula JLT2003]|uniref:Ribonuclease, Rne/Rng family protein n=1 Tax=Oceaniovalibus guishaninsula JLT2003 TaxID=1231392 RepID=K2HQ67_9RHOB|nr:ribonuclease E/G [Oceaniovalibus guishaninsula]EKE44979.1 ribonuclease, Rne/Rng family protein [Oceaniovalibus guishaninsula JLT2003]